MPTHPWLAGSTYLLSGFLDAFDGLAARKFNQSTMFGAVLDMITDRQALQWTPQSNVACYSSLTCTVGHINRPMMILARLYTMNDHLHDYLGFGRLLAYHCKDTCKCKWNVRSLVGMPLTIDI